jgi:Rieske Fe-S protein
VCTHEGCTVNKVANGLIVCPCHFSEYSITNGAVKAGPALRPLGPKPITVADGQITLD